MQGRKILLVILEDKEAYLMVDLAYKLRNSGYDAHILKNWTSELYVPLACQDELLVEDGHNFDLIAAGPDYSSKFDDSILDDINLREPEILGIESLRNIDHILEKIQAATKEYELEAYSFLFTLGYFNEHLTNNHYIGTYENHELIKGLIRYLVLKGAHVSIIASDNIGRVEFVEDVQYVKEITELETVLNSKFFKYDFVIDAINIPRFSLARGERFKIEYQRYFAEFQEKYIPFKEKDLKSFNQLIIEVMNGKIDNDEAITYLFDNTAVDLVMLSELEGTGKGYKPFLRLIDKKGYADVLTFKESGNLYRELVNLLKEKIEG